MLLFITRRIASMLVALAIAAAVVFFILFLTPGDPAVVMLGPEASDPQAVARIRQQLGLDNPLPIQLRDYYLRLLRLDLGTSTFTQEPVTQVIARNLEPTLILVLVAISGSVLVGIPIGVLAAVRHNTWLDQGLTVLATLGFSVPNFWLGLNLIIVLAVFVPLFPAQGFEPLSDGVGASLRSLFLPALALGAQQVALIARMTRSSMLEVLSADYIRTATAKGLQRRVVLYRHALRNALPLLLSVIGLSIALLLGGTVVVERVFNIHGVGDLITSAIERRDYPVVQGTVLVLAASYVLISTVLDIAYAYVDPQIRLR